MRIANLEKTVERLQSELAITKNVNDILTNEADDLQQYQQHQRIVINSLQTKPNETYHKSLKRLKMHLLNN